MNSTQRTDLCEAIVAGDRREAERSALLASLRRAPLSAVQLECLRQRGELLPTLAGLTLTELRLVAVTLAWLNGSRDYDGYESRLLAALRRYAGEELARERREAQTDSDVAWADLAHAARWAKVAS